MAKKGVKNRRPKAGVVVNVCEKPTPPKRKRTKTPKSVRNPWLASLLNPWNEGVPNIPDDRTMDSWKTKSFFINDQATKAELGTSNTHALCIIMAPGLCGGAIQMFPETSAGNGNISATACDTGSPLNLSALQAGGSETDGLRNQYRPVSMGIRLTYLGTEVNRAGHIRIGLVPSQVSSSSNLFAHLFGTTAWTLGAITSAMIDMVECRTSDGTIEYTWKPNRTPSYMYARGDGSITLATGSPGSKAIEAGQYYIVALIDDDYTSSATLNGNYFRVETVWNWEILPRALTTIGGNLSPSPYDVRLMQQAVNALAHVACGRVVPSFDYMRDDDYVDANDEPSLFESARDLASKATGFVTDNPSYLRIMTHAAMRYWAARNQQRFNQPLLQY